MKQTLRHVAFITVMSLFGLTGRGPSSLFISRWRPGWVGNHQCCGRSMPIVHSLDPRR